MAVHGKFKGVRYRMAAYRTIRRSQAVQDELRRRAVRIADAAGGDDAGVYVQTSLGKGRARAVVINTAGDTVDREILSAAAGMGGS